MKIATHVRAAGLDIVMNRRVKIEHARFFGFNPVGMNTGGVTARRRVG